MWEEISHMRESQQWINSLHAGNTLCHERSTESNVLHTLKTNSFSFDWDGTVWHMPTTSLVDQYVNIYIYIYIYIAVFFLDHLHLFLYLPYTQHYFLLIILFKFIMFIFPCQNSLYFSYLSASFLLMNCYSQNYSRSAPKKIVSIQFSIWSTQKSINMF